ncbi:MAG: hypothetical protein M1358_14910 [Chloroflexi bacterium]|nr:hypothetical protein [Chloroflexota bacterium]
METRNVDRGQVVIERGSGVGMGVILGVILAIVVALAIMWFVFGANMMSGTATGGSQSNPNNGTDINITAPKTDINIAVPNQQPSGPSQPSGGGSQP